MAAKINWHRHGTKLRHLHRYVCWNFETEIFNSLACTLDTLSAPSCSTVYFWRMFTLRDMNAIHLSRTLHKVNMECNAALDDCSSPQFSHRVRRAHGQSCSRPRFAIALIYGQISVQARTDRHARGCGQVTGQTETRSKPLEHIFRRRERRTKRHVYGRRGGVAAGTSSSSSSCNNEDRHSAAMQVGLGLS